MLSASNTTERRVNEPDFQVETLPQVRPGRYNSALTKKPALMWEKDGRHGTPQYSGVNCSLASLICSQFMGCR